MGEGFDELTRAVSASHSRRGVLKLLGGAAVATAAATVLRPFRADAACAAGQTPCGPNCCPKGVPCVNSRTGVCGCPSGKTKCGTDETGQPVCCTGTCSDPTTHCCCASGTTPCGPNCCKAGVACVDKASGTCGCPAGTTPCGSGANLTCCSAGQPCNSTNSVCAPPSSTSAGCSGTSPRTCGTCQPCAGAEQPICGSGPEGTTCYCLQQSSGCVCIVGACGPPCESNADCGPNAICEETGNCCGGKACLALCSGGGGTCGDVPICGPTCAGGECSLTSTVAGTCACVQPHCGYSCDSDGDCASGQVCGAAECCGGLPVCLDLCGAAPAVAPATSGSTWGTRSTTPYNS